MSEKQFGGRKGWRWPMLARAERITLLAAAVSGASTVLVDRLVGFAVEVVRAVRG
ncbi:hypothetical protein ACIQWL_49415 [Streptomyces mirabilis]|uniref:hypothetical protein n=1 Tax=Streptomyces mirabilis TaxID=68239 RepID=UPI00380F8E12